MKHVRNLSSLIFVVSLLFIAACGRTTVTSSWKKSDYTGPPFKSILVVALIDDPNRKMFWENTVSDRLRESGIKIVASSITAFPNDRGLEAKDIIRYVQEQKVDGVLVTRLVDIQTKEAPAPAQGPVFTTFYPQAYNSVYGGRDTTTLTTVVLETNLYSSETLELVWSMYSDTLEARSIEKLAGSVSKTVISTLKKDGLL
jgi:hypothetical protein